MSRGEQERLRDIQDAIATIHRHLEQADETTTAKEDPLLHDALLFQFVVIGEAVKHLSPQTRESAPRIPWTDIAGLREAQTRPFVVIDLDSSAHTLFDLVVKNIGPTLARDVHFEFDPPIKSTDDDLDPNKIKIFRDGISTLAPGKEIRTLFDKGPARHRSDLPDTYEVTVTYADQTGKRRYVEKIDLDFGLYWDRLTVNRRDVHDLHRQLETIAKEIGTWRPNLGRGLLAVTTAYVEKRNAEALEQVEAHRADQGDRPHPTGDGEENPAE